ncbi:dirigent protein 24-like [Juglans microcarpa x Juglans regia]|uniref:dirigent protein 24-like n=1 Tax=Juglans microcarpa x Juglans regia TaxID=2249226 RepID=UPI001B7F42EA|nr:dirigent protein 24-like [Juglans microcarpa x Juglans regia]
MAKLSLLTRVTFKAICLLLLAITFECANSVRVLLDVDPQPSVLPDPPQPTNPVATTVPNVTPQVGLTTTTLPSGQIPATPAADDTNPPLPESEIPIVDIPPIASPAAESDADSPQPELEEPDAVAAPVAGVAPEVGPTNSPTGTASPVTTTTSATVAKPVGPQTPALTFFMHDILGGTHPSARVVTGIIANTQFNGLPFTQPNDNIFPLTGGVPLSNVDLSGIVNNNNLPIIAGLNGVDPQASTVIQNSGNNDIIDSSNGNLPFVTAGQLPSGLTLQKLMFGSLTVIDDELSEGHDLGSPVIGKAQGFYLSSSLDGTSQTIAVTVLLHGLSGGDHLQVVEDTISFFGVHRSAMHESQIVVIGGTGKYENAKGYATVETLHQEDQHATDGVDTILQFSVFLCE